MGHFRTLPHAIFQRREGCEPYILRVCSWHFPPHGAALLSGLSSVTPQGCVVGCYPAVCSVQDYCIRPEKMGAPRKDLADAILSYNGNDSQKNGEPFFKSLSEDYSSDPRRRAVAPVNTYTALSSRWRGLSASDVLAPLLTPLTLWRNPPVGGRAANHTSHVYAVGTSLPIIPTIQKAGIEKATTIHPVCMQ